MEYHDGLPVTGYEVRFAGRQEMPQDYGENLYKGHVAVFLVAGLPDDHAATYVTRKDFEERVRRYVINLESAIPLTGRLRDQAITHISYEGDQGALDFTDPSEAELALDRLRTVMQAKLPGSLPAELNAGVLVQAVIETLGLIDKLELAPASEPPELESSTAVEDSPEPAGPLAVDDPSPDPILCTVCKMRATTTGICAECASEADEELEEKLAMVDQLAKAKPKSKPRKAKVAAVERVAVEAERVAVDNTEPEKPVDPNAPVSIEQLRAILAEEEDTPKGGTLGTMKFNIDADYAGAVDDDGFPVTEMDDVEVVSEPNAKKTHRLIEGALPR